MILADEPVASLDPVLAHSILGQLEKLNREDGMTVICSLHYLDLVQRYATQVIGLREGQSILWPDREGHERELKIVSVSHAAQTTGGLPGGDRENS